MKSFAYYNPVKILFGENAIENLPAQVARYQNILLAYGGGSIKKNGIYEKVSACLEGKHVVELSGIMSNPRTEKVYEGIQLCREHQIEFILAVGGGSTIDCCKMISAGAKLDGDFWETFMIRQQSCEESLPMGVVLTMAGTGSEMNCLAVISKWDEQLKNSYESEQLFAEFAIMDPTWTYSLPERQMVSGAVDTFSHIMEVYFSTPDESNVSDALSEALMKHLIENVNAAIQNPMDYTARSNMMWISTLAINSILALSKDTDWMSHMIEHAVSAFHDVPHGLGLAAIHPNYLRFVYRNAIPRFVRFAKEIWGVNTEQKTDEDVALEGICRMREWFRSLGAPVTLEALGVPEESIPAMAERTVRYATAYSDLSQEDVQQILRNSMKEW